MWLADSVVIVVTMDGISRWCASKERVYVHGVA